MRKKRFRYVGEYREGMKLEVGDIYRDASGVGFVVTPDRIQPVVAPVDAADIIVGPAGPPGPPGESIVGPPGKDGPAGNPGTGFRFRGKWKRSLAFEPNDVCTHEGQTWIATKAVTKSEPGVSKAFVLLAAKGEDGRDGYHTSSHRVTRTETVVGSGSVTMEAIFDSNTLAGQVVYISGDGHVDLAQANGEPQTYTVGIAIQDVIAGQPGEYIPVGPVSCETWSLTPGSVYYLSPSSPGGMTTVYPSGSGQFVVVLGAATTATQLNLQIHWLLEQP